MMIRQNSSFCRAVLLAAALSISQPLFASDLSSGDPASAPSQSGSDVEKLRAQLAQQQIQLEQLKAAMESQRALLEKLLNDPNKPKNAGLVASLTPLVPAAVPSPDLNALSPLPAALPAADSLHSMQDDKPFPTSVAIGNSYITPIGFMDFTMVNRSTASGSGIGSNFGSIPYNNVANARLSENRLSIQNSRIGARFDSVFKGMKVLGYWESDFLGNNPTNVAVSSNSDTFRLRLYWVDLQKDGWELLAGQSWSLMTPGRQGISPLPANLFYTQDMDVNYQVGLTWARQPGLRLAYHAKNGLSFAAALEESEQYVGGSGGAGVIVPPAGIASTVFTQFNNGATTFSTPNAAPDIIAKVAWDPSTHFHGEIVGIERTFKSYNLALNQHFTKAGTGGALNLNLEVVKGLHLITNNFWGSGGGRYVFGQAPDLILKPNGDIGLVHELSSVTGLEETLGKTLFYAYYGGIFIGRNTTIDPATGKPVGYGYTGSTNAQNRTVQEYTFGFNQTLWKDARYGALNLMGQYSYNTRNPWYVALGTAKNTHQNQIYIDLRYTLPGAPPSLK